MFHNRIPADDALLDAIEAARRAELELQFDRAVPDTTGIPPWSEASAGWLAQQPTIADRERELAELTAWLDALIATLPDDDDAE